MVYFLQKTLVDPDLFYFKNKEMDFKKVKEEK